MTEQNFNDLVRIHLATGWSRWRGGTDQWDYRRAAFERMAQRSPRCSPAASNRYRKQLGFVQVKAEADLFAGKGR